MFKDLVRLLRLEYYKDPSHGMPKRNKQAQTSLWFMSLGWWK